MAPDPQEVPDIAHERETAMQNDRTRWDVLEKVYHGRFAELWPQEFRAGEVPKTANFIRRDWDAFARMVGKVPDIRVTPLRLGTREQDRSDKLEKICFWYNRLWDYRRKARVIADFAVGMGAFGIGLIPHDAAEAPILLVEDPRNCLPGPGWDSTSTYAWNPPSPMSDAGGTLEDMIVRKSMTGHQLWRMFPGPVTEQLRGDRGMQLIYQWYDDEVCMTVWEGNAVGSYEHGCDWCPWQFPTTFAIGAPAGTSTFEQTIGLEIAFMRLLDQKLALNDSVVWPWMFAKGVRPVPEKRLLMAETPDADAKLVSPPATFQVDRDMTLVQQLIRTMHNETEAGRGEVTGGPITGRGLVELSRVTVETVQAFFDDFSFWLPKVYTSALVMDREIYGDREKVISARGHGETFLESYRPAKDIGERFGMVEVEYGPGLGGFEDRLSMLQVLGADAISVDTVMEGLPWIRSLSAEKRRIFVGKMEKFLLEEAFSGQAAVPVDWILSAIEEAESGRDYRKWMADNPPMQAQATPETVPPVPPGAAPPPGPMAPPPPGLAALMGQGG
jgi:hypothetical protein